MLEQPDPGQVQLAVEVKLPLGVLYFFLTALVLFQIEKVIIQIRNCSTKRSAESPMYKKLVEKMKETKDQERIAQLQKAEKLLSNETNCNNGNDEADSKDEPPVKKVKSGEEKKTDSKTSEWKAVEKEETDKGDKKQKKQLPFNEEKYLRKMDKWCENCRMEIADPKPAELVMYLHAVKLKVKCLQCKLSSR